MRAVYIDRYGPPDVLKFGEVEDPKLPSDDHVLVRVKASSVNNLDIITRRGAYKFLIKRFPHILGADLAGVIEKVGRNVKDLAEGERVIGYPILYDGKCYWCKNGYENLCDNLGVVGRDLSGSYAEYVVVPAKNVYPMPKNLDYYQASTIQLALITAWHALTKRVSIKEGDTVFIWGGSGGVGTFAIQIAKLFGATVITATSNDDKARKLKEMGADYVINYKEDDVEKKVLEYTNGLGADIVLDTIGPLTINKSIRIAKKRGKVIVLGFWGTDDDTVSFTLRSIYLKHVSIVGSAMGTRNDMVEALREVIRGGIKPIIDSVIKLEEARRAHERFESNEKFGKIVLSVD
ncbi:MAG: zinc-binding dehydrogenase [Sulfolobaceae archaeon]|nr:zinc-binding dehydrogenase [Sulfolobaceae archaeon]